MKILITGGTGFLGRNLIEELSRDNYKIKLLVRKDENLDNLKKYKLNFVYGDITDKESLVRACKDIDMVIHMAGLINQRNSYKDQYDVHVNGIKYIVEACKKNHIKRIISISSMAAKNKYLDNYGKTKLQGEHILKRSNLDYTILRPSVLYGKNSNSFLNLVGQMNMFPLFLPIVGDGRYKLSPVYVKDVVYAIISCVKNKKTVKNEYDLMGPYKISFNEFVRIIKEEFKIKKINVHVPYFICYTLAFFAESFMKYPVLTKQNIMNTKEGTPGDISKARKDFGYEPIGFKEGIKYAI